MTAIQETAYPRFPTDIPPSELDAVYTPTSHEVQWAQRAKQPQQRFFLLLHLKAYQKLGFFMPSEALPTDLVQHVAQQLGLRKPPTKTLRKQYDQSGARNRHAKWIREYVGSRVMSGQDRLWLAKQALSAAESREILADIIRPC